MYWRIVDPNHIQSLAHGTATTQAGVVEQIATFLRTAELRKILCSSDGHGIEVVIQREYPTETAS